MVLCRYVLHVTPICGPLLVCFMSLTSYLETVSYDCAFRLHSVRYCMYYSTSSEVSLAEMRRRNCIQPAYVYAMCSASMPIA